MTPRDPLITADERHLLRWHRIMLAFGIVPLLIVGPGDLRDSAALPFILASTIGLAISVKQLWPPSADKHPQN